MIFVSTAVSFVVSPIAQQTSDYFPLAIGNRWTYHYEVGTRTGVFDVRINSKETVGSVECYVREYVLQQGNQRECYAWSGDQLFLYKTVADYKVYFLQPPALYLDSPSVTGHKWISRNEARGENGDVVRATESFEVIGPASVTVSAGTFDTIKIQVTHTNGGSAVGTRWFARGVGQVKDVSNSQGVTITTELMSYQLGSQTSSTESQSYSLGGVVTGSTEIATVPTIPSYLYIILATAAGVVFLFLFNQRLKSGKTETEPSKPVSKGKLSCINCGAKLPKGSTSCNKCGSKSTTTDGHMMPLSDEELANDGVVDVNWYRKMIRAADRRTTEK